MTYQMILMLTYERHVQSPGLGVAGAGVRTSGRGVSETQQQPTPARRGERARQPPLAGRQPPQPQKRRRTQPDAATRTKPTTRAEKLVPPLTRHAAAPASQAGPGAAAAIHHRARRTEEQARDEPLRLRKTRWPQDAKRETAPTKATEAREEPGPEIYNIIGLREFNTTELSRISAAAWSRIRKIIG